MTQVQPKEIEKFEIKKKDNDPVLFQTPVKKQNQSTQPLFKSKLFFYILSTNGQIAFYCTGATLGFYNTLTNHIPNIYGWNDDQKDTYMGFVNSCFNFQQIKISLVVGIGAIAGAIIAWIYGLKFGRRTFMIVGYLIFIFGSLLTLIVNTPILLIGRLIQGLSNGFLQFAGPSYLMEFSPNECKGYNSVALSFAFRFGLFFQYLLGFGLPDEENTTSNYWRFTLLFPLVIIVPSLLSHFLVNNLIQQNIILKIFTKETPYYHLVATNNNAKAMESLHWLHNPEPAKREFQSLVQFKQSQKKKITVREIFRSYSWQLIVCIFMTITFQITGCSSLFTFSNKIIEETGESQDTATLFTTLSSICDLAGASGGAYLINHIGRKTLFLLSSVFVSFNNVIFAILGYSDLNSAQKFLILSFRLVNSLGIDPVYWGYFAEVLPPVGCSIIIITFQGLNALFVQTLLPLISAFGVNTTILLYGIGAFIFSFIVWLFMLEIRGKSKEQQFLEFSQQNIIMIFKRLVTLGKSPNKVQNEQNEEQIQEQYSLGQLSARPLQNSESKEQGEEKNEIQENPSQENPSPNKLNDD